MERELVQRHPTRAAAPDLFRGQQRVAGDGLHTDGAGKDGDPRSDGADADQSAMDDTHSKCGQRAISSALANHWRGSSSLAAEML